MTLKKAVYSADKKLAFNIFWSIVFCLAFLSGTLFADANLPTDIDRRVQEILKSLTLEQKVGQMVQGEIKFVKPEDVTKYHLGSVLNGGGSFPGNNKHSKVRDWLALADEYYLASLDRSQGGAGIPIVWGTDAVHGHNNVIGATLFPHNIGLGVANDPSLMKKIGEITATEVAVTGIDWAFAPTVAVVKDNRWGRTYEGYSSESPIIKSYAGEIVLGLQGEIEELAKNDSKVIATAKHFIGDGGTLRGVDQGDTIMPLDQLLATHGQGYYEAIDAGVQTVMASFNRWNGKKIHGQKFLLTDLLKDQMGFDGFVISDWNGIGQIEGCTNESCAQAINAGIDMVMVPKVWKEFLTNTIAQVESGEIPMSRIDDAVARILRVKIRAGLYDKGLPSSRKNAGNENLIGAIEHREVAREAVRKSLVLFKNNNNVLPITSEKRVLIAGDGANNIGKQNGGWTITWQGTENQNSDFPGATSIYDGLKSAIQDIGGSTELSTDGSWINRPDVAVVVFGEEPYAEGQGDIHLLNYSGNLNSDLNLLRKLKAEKIPVISVFLTGRPLWVNALINSSDAFVVAWLPGSEGGGVADVLVAGPDNKPRYDFAGRLSFDWPNKEVNAIDDDMPANDYLLRLGQGFTYADNDFMSIALSETPTANASAKANIVFSGSTREPWKAYLGDASDWHRPVSGNSTSSAYGALSITTVDGAVQEDSRRLSWSGGRESQFYWQGEAPADLSELGSKGGALVMEFMVDKHPEGKVKQRMDCGWPCSGTIEMADFFRSIPEGKVSRIGISLDCFAKIGVDLTKVTAPLVLVSEQPFALTFRDVRVVPSMPDGDMVGCGES